MSSWQAKSDGAAPSQSSAAMCGVLPKAPSDVAARLLGGFPSHDLRPRYNVVWSMSGVPVEWGGFPVTVHTGLAASFEDVQLAIEIQLLWQRGSRQIVNPERWRGCSYLSAGTIGSAYPLQIVILRNEVGPVLRLLG